jgi:hypothetical protein
MGNLQGFDANQYEAQSFDVLPAGEYDVVIVSSTVQKTKSGTGKLLKLELQVINGPFKNRKLFDNLNLWNSSQEAQKIARGQMSAICRAIGNLTPKDSSELHMKPIRCKVRIKKSDEYGASNKIVGYKACAASTPATINGGGGTGAPWPQAMVDPADARGWTETQQQAESVF